MSLKHFHVFFIATVLALMAFLAYWSGQRALLNEGTWFPVVASIGGFILGPFYLRWFLKKHKSVH